MVGKHLMDEFLDRCDKAGYTMLEADIDDFMKKHSSDDIRFLLDAFSRYDIKHVLEALGVK